MPTIELDHVSKIYKPRYWKRRGMDQDLGVMDVDLTIKQGEFVFVVGDSGSGKSTLLQLIAGQTKPTRGKVYVDKKDLNWMMKMSRNRASPPGLGLFSPGPGSYGGSPSRRQCWRRWSDFPPPSVSGSG